jgi:hypothetical protein
MTKKKMAIARRKDVGKSDAPIRHAVSDKFYQSIAEVLRAARSKAYHAVDFAMVEAYWTIGRMILEEEQ